MTRLFTRRSAAPAPAADIPHNRWDRLKPPKADDWKPTRTVSVVVPAFQCQHELDLTFASLSQQTYPSSLLQVVVVDDGSDPPLERPASGRDLDVVMLRQENSGFGSGKARNAGVEAASGELLILLDADMIPAPWQVEAHARWHHTARDLVTLGWRVHLDVDGLSAEDVASAARSGSPDDMAAAFGERELGGVQWIEGFVERTRQLTTQRPDHFRIFTGGNSGMSTEMWREAGGMHVFGVRGIEDTELAYRLSNLGAVFVPVPDAMNWHQGPSYFQTERKAQAKHERVPLLANYVPIGGFRSTSGGRSYAVPALALIIPVGDTPPAGVVELVDAAFAGSFQDISVTLLVAPDYAEAKFLRDSFASDHRVTVAADDGRPPYELVGDTPVFVVLPPEAVPGHETLAGIFSRLTAATIGALHLTVPGCHPRRAMLHAYATGASRRAARIAADTDADWEATVGTVFGETWAAGVDVGVKQFDEGAAGAAAEDAVQEAARPE